MTRHSFNPKYAIEAAQINRIAAAQDRQRPQERTGTGKSRMKHITAFIAALALSACTAPAPGSIADGASTAITLSQGAVEANPLIAAACPTSDPLMVGLCAIGVQSVVAEGLVAAGVDRGTVRRTQNVLGFGVACSNFAGGGPAGIVAMLICGSITYEATKP